MEYYIIKFCLKSKTLSIWLESYKLIITNKSLVSTHCIKNNYDYNSIVSLYKFVTNNKKIKINNLIFFIFS